MDKSTGKYQLYGSEISLFTAKVRAYLAYKGIPFIDNMPILQAWKLIPGLKIVPIVKTPDDVTLQDSTEIIDFLERRFPESPIYPSTPKQRIASLILETYGDEWLPIAAMHYRWNHNKDLLYPEFGASVTPCAPRFIKSLIGKQLSKMFSGFLPILGVSAKTEKAIEKNYEGLLDELNAHFSQHPFLLGSRPCIADFSLFGSLYAHQFRDPRSGEHMKGRAPEVVKWIQRLRNPAPGSGEFIENDEIPDTLIPVLQRFFNDCMPVLISTVDAVQQWLPRHRYQTIPRSIGEHRFAIEGVTEKRSIFPYSQWMLQRVLDNYQALTSKQKQTVNTLLKETGGQEAMQLEIPERVCRQGYRLVAEPYAPSPLVTS